MGLIQPTKGFVYVDGTKLTSKDLPAWRLNIAHVPQAIFLFETSVKQNITLQSDVSGYHEEHLKLAIWASCVDEFLDKLPSGVDTDVGERGQLLSGGQRQRIGIARALYRRASVLVFDEATSALDRKTEGQVFQRIMATWPEITVIMISHSPKALEFCDRSIEFKQGRLVPAVH